MGRKFVFSVGEFYHIYNRGTDKRIIFPEKADSFRFLSLLYLCNSTRVIHLSDHRDISFFDLLKIPRGGALVDVGVYCLMPNHFHLLLHEKIENGISLFVQKLSTGYTMYFNKKYERSGALFEGKFRAKHIDNDEYLKYLFSYIHLNPIKNIDPLWKENGIVDRYGAEKYLRSYMFSSYLDYVEINRRKESLIINKAAFPEYFLEAHGFEEEISDWLSFPLSRSNLDSGKE